MKTASQTVYPYSPVSSSFKKSEGINSVEASGCERSSLSFLNQISPLGGASVEMTGREICEIRG